METKTATEHRRAADTRRRTWWRVGKRIGWAVSGLLLIGGLAAAWMPRPVAVEAAVVTRGPMRVTVDEDGQARVRDRYVVSAPLAGSLGRIEHDAGDPVQAGEVLARIAPMQPALLDERTRTTANARLSQALAAQRQSEVQIEHAQATFDFAAAEAKRHQQLVERGAGILQALDQAELNERRTAHELDAQKFAARVADYEVEMARAALVQLSGRRSAHLEVPSPINGQVLKVLHKSEGVVQPGTPLIEVGNPAALEIAVDVLTSDAVRIHAGAPVTIERWGGVPLEARVRRIEPSAFTRLSALGVEEQRVNVLIDVTSPRQSWADLGDGYRVEARIIVWEAPNVVKVPTSALFRRGSGWALFRVDDGRAHLLEVSVGQRTAREAEILGGLAAGDRVIAHPGDRVRDDVRVTAP